VKHIHYVAEIADIHRSRIEAGAAAAGQIAEGRHSLWIRRLIGHDDGNASSEQVAHDGLADEAHATCHEKFHARRILFLTFI
jgi:hypothetical protein